MTYIDCIFKNMNPTNFITSRLH